MTSSWPDPLPDAPVSPQSLADLALAMRAAEVSDSARAFVPHGGAVRYDGTLFGDALRFLRDAEDLVAAVVIAERAHGATWDDLASAAEQAKSTVHKRWSPAETAWHARLDEAEDQALLAPARAADHPRPVLGDDPCDIAARLDKWVARHAGPGDLPRGDAAVTTLIQHMDPLAEYGYLTRQRSRLLDRYMVPPPALLAPLAERAALLDDAVARQALDPREAAKLRASAGKNRAWAAQLRQQAELGDTGAEWPLPASTPGGPAAASGISAEPTS